MSFYQLICSLHGWITMECRFLAISHYVICWYVVSVILTNYTMISSHTSTFHVKYKLIVKMT